MLPIPLSEASSGNNPLKYTDPSGYLFYYKGAWLSDYKDWVSNPFGSSGGGSFESPGSGGGSRRGDPRLDAYSAFVKSLGTGGEELVIAEWKGEWVYFPNHGYSYVYDNELTFRTISLESVNAISEPWIPHPRREEGIIGESSWKNLGVWARESNLLNFDGGVYVKDDPSNKAARVVARYGSAFITPTSVLMDGHTIYNGVLGNTQVSGTDIGVSVVDFIINSFMPVPVQVDLLWGGFTGTYDNYQNEWKNK